MYTSIILLCFLPILANCDKTLHNGPCPKPPPAEDPSKFVDIVGMWKTTLDNYEDLEEKPMDCAGCMLTAIPNNTEVFYKSYVYKQSNEQYHTNQTFTPNKDQTVWMTSTLNEKTQKYIPDGWFYTLIKLEGEGEDKGVLEYACKNEGLQHRSFYRILGRQIPPNAKVQETLEAEYKKVGDGRKMFTTNWDNCD